MDFFLKSFAQIIVFGETPKSLAIVCTVSPSRTTYTLISSVLGIIISGSFAARIEPWSKEINPSD